MLCNSVLVIKRGDKFKRLCKDYGFTVHESLSVYRVYDKFCLQFQ